MEVMNTTSQNKLYRYIIIHPTQRQVPYEANNYVHSCGIDSLASTAY